MDLDDKAESNSYFDYRHRCYAVYCTAHDGTWYTPRMVTVFSTYRAPGSCFLSEVLVQGAVTTFLARYTYESRYTGTFGNSQILKGKLLHSLFCLIRPSGNR